MKTCVSYYGRRIKILHWLKNLAPSIRGFLCNDLLTLAPIPCNLAFSRLVTLRNLSNPVRITGSSVYQMRLGPNPARCNKFTCVEYGRMCPLALKSLIAKLYQYRLEWYHLNDKKYSLIPIYLLELNLDIPLSKTQETGLKNAFLY